MDPVSYTHLDVYKRQLYDRSGKQVGEGIFNGDIGTIRKISGTNVVDVYKRQIIMATICVKFQRCWELRYLGRRKSIRERKSISDVYKRQESESPKRVCHNFCFHGMAFEKDSQ